MAYNVLDIFSGAGGLMLGFEQEGFNIVLSTDIDEDCEKVHNVNRPNKKYVRADIYELTNEKITELIGNEEIDVLIGGPPCQGFSTIGARVSSDPGKRTQHDPRNDLFREYIRVLKHVNPKIFLFENVKGIKTRDKGRIFADIEKTFKETGYDFKCVTLNAADFGVPQIRERVFLFGTRLHKPFDAPEKTHGEGLKDYKTVLEAIGDLADLGNDPAINHVALNHGEINIRRYKLIPEGGRMPEHDLPPELYRKNFGNTFKRLDRNKPSLTMVPGHNAFPIHPWLNRSLTVREAARIQMFPDDYIFQGNRQKQCMQEMPCRLAWLEPGLKK